MDTFFSYIPGMSSRIGNHVDFPNYETDELVDIATVPYTPPLFLRRRLVSTRGGGTEPPPLSPKRAALRTHAHTRVFVTERFAWSCQVMVRDLEYSLADDAQETFKQYIAKRREMPYFSNARTVLVWGTREQRRQGGS